MIEYNKIYGALNSVIGASSRSSNISGAVGDKTLVIELFNRLGYSSEDSLERLIRSLLISSLGDVAAEYDPNNTYSIPLESADLSDNIPSYKYLPTYPIHPDYAETFRFASNNIDKLACYTLTAVRGYIDGKR